MKVKLNKDVYREDYYKFEKGQEFEVKNRQPHITLVTDTLVGIDYWLKNEDLDLIFENKREEAMFWFYGLASLRKTQLCDTNTEIVGHARRWETLTGREIELIYEHKNK